VVAADGTAEAKQKNPALTTARSICSLRYIFKPALQM
jgi:hypothetical protein